MTNLKFLKTSTALVALSTAFCESTWAECAEGQVLGITTKTCIASSGTCGNGCSYTIDAQGNLKIAGNGNGTIREAAFRFNTNIVNTYITGISKVSWLAFDGAGTGAGIIKVSDDARDINGGFAGAKFSTIDIASKNFTADGSGTFNSAYIKTLIISGDNPHVLYTTSFTNSASNTAVTDIDIKCKGKINDCEKMLGSSISRLKNAGGNPTLDHYKGYNSEGNWEEWSDEGYKVYSDLSKKQLLSIHDLTGKLLSAYGSDGSVYYYDSKGNLKGMTKRGPFTIPEADAATKKGPVNTLTITW